MHFPRLEVIKTNVHTLFAISPFSREELSSKFHKVPNPPQKEDLATLPALLTPSVSPLEVPSEARNYIVPELPRERLSILEEKSSKVSTQLAPIKHGHFRFRDNTMPDQLSAKWGKMLEEIKLVSTN